MKDTITALALGAALCAGVGCARGSDDGEFARDAARIGRLEVELGNYAVSNAQSPEVQAFRDLVARSEVTPWAIDVVMPSLAEAQRLAQELETLAPVKAAVTLADFVPAHQEEKREVLADAALFLPPVAGG